MSERVFVTGIGIISAIGSMLNQVFGILSKKVEPVSDQLTLIDSVYKDEIPVAEIKAPMRNCWKRPCRG